MNTEQVINTPRCSIMSFMVDQATRTEPVALVGTPSRVHLSPFTSDKLEPVSNGVDPLFEALLATSWS